MGITDRQHQFIKKASQNEELMRKLEKEDPNIRTKMAAMQLSRWVPVGIARKTLMIVFVLAGSLGLYFSGSLWFLLCFVMASAFSPRIVGNCFIYMGFFMQGVDEGRKRT